MAVSFEVLEGGKTTVIASPPALVVLAQPIPASTISLSCRSVTNFALMRVLPFALGFAAWGIGIKMLANSMGA